MWKTIRIIVQAIVAAGLIALLVWLAHKYDVVARLKTIDRRYLGLALVVIFISTFINTIRWFLLLQNVGIRRSVLSLWPLYLIGLFFSQFLPTGTGGDAVRIFEVARRSGKTAGAVMAVLQERVFGLGISMLLGLFATSYYWDRIPANLRIWVLLIQIAGPSGLLVFLYPHFFIRMMHRLLGSRADKLMRILQPVLDLPKLSPARLLSVAVVTAIGVIVSCLVYAILARALKIEVSLLGFILAVPLGWVIKMAPISLGGIGLAEGTLIVALGLLFDIEKEPATALAFVYLGLTILAALSGGVLVAIRMATGTWIPPKSASTSAVASGDLVIPNYAAASRDSVGSSDPESVKGPS